MIRWVMLALAIGIAGACAGTPDKNARTEVVAPDRAQFDSVGLYLDKRCGSLDCHGHIARNLKLYGYYGLRFAPDDFPGGGDTTPRELDANYRSVVGLEPEIISRVVSEGGANPERLTLIRKIRGTEDHKGGQLVNAGDAQDRCITSWLAGKTDEAACKSALEVF